MASPYHGMNGEISVMLIDNDKEFVNEMTSLLNAHGYRVITVDTTSSAMSMLSKGKQKIDVIILNVRLSNSSFVDLLAQAEALNIISLAVCDEFNEFVAKKTLDDGAYLYLKKPFNKEILIYLWQFVLAERKRKEKAREGSRKHKDQMKVNMINIVEENKESEENIGKYTLKRKKGTKSMQNNAIDKVVRRKDCKEWTEDLHAAFMRAVSQLGEGRKFTLLIIIFSF
ncbi:putative two-component response regulator ARR21 [Solanum pennellii]|uniref:Two-component response regulator ARR21 n=1 Tax=Solanum pennellii TaxID=28526 RepID=A0ABM1V6P7_SOLPN|nr:putative two-component response regulator ARR21 [Solanum pennellii]